MDVLTFIAEVIKAGAWPTAAITIALIFRRQLRDLLSRIRKGKVGPAEFEFEQEVQELSASATASQQPPQIGTPTVTLATSNPRVAILEAWLGLESVAQRLIYQEQVAVADIPRSAVSLSRAIKKSGLVPVEDIALFNDLRVRRSRATHDVDFTPSPESVIQYVQPASGLKERLERAANNR